MPTIHSTEGGVGRAGWRGSVVGGYGSMSARGFQGNFTNNMLQYLQLIYRNC